MIHVPYEKQSQWLRHRYYQNTTFFDNMAKSYGELGWFKQVVLFTLSVSPSCLFYINPSFFLAGCLLGGFLLILRTQYNALEARFKLLVEDLESTELQIVQLMTNNHELEEKVTEAFKKNELVANSLEDSKVYIKNLEAECHQAYQKATHACQLIFNSSNQATEVTADFIKVLTCAVKNMKNLSEVFDKALERFENIKQTDEEIHAIVAFRQDMEAHLIQTYGEEYTVFCQFYDSNHAQIASA